MNRHYPMNRQNHHRALLSLSRHYQMTLLISVSCWGYFSKSIVFRNRSFFDFRCLGLRWLWIQYLQRRVVSWNRHFWGVKYTGSEIGESLIRILLPCRVLVVSCRVLSLSCLCLISPCRAVSCLVVPCLVLSFWLSSTLFLSCLVFVLSCLVLPCLVLIFFPVQFHLELPCLETKTKTEDKDRRQRQRQRQRQRKDLTWRQRRRPKTKNEDKGKDKDKVMFWWN